MPEDPKNEEYVNNLEVLADPIYNPENYIFVNEFEKEMDKIMNKLGKIEKENDPEKEEDKIEVSDCYLSHLNNLFSKVIPFLDDLHKDMLNTPEGQLPDIKKEKEENFDKVLNATDTYYKTDEDQEIKSSISKNLCDSLLNLIDDYSKPGRLDLKKYKNKEKEDDKEKLPEKLDEKEIPTNKKEEENTKKGKEKLNKLWNLVGETVKNDDNNLLLVPNNTH